VQSGLTTAINCLQTLLGSEDSDLELAGLEVENIIDVPTSDGVLVADMDRAQDVKLALKAPTEKGARVAEQFPKDHRP